MDTPYSLPSDASRPAGMGWDLPRGRGDGADPSIPSHAYCSMMDNWHLIYHLKGGTEAMRAARESYLPKEPKESDAQYAVRLSRSFLYGALGSTIDTLTAKPFSRPITLKNEDKLPESLQSMSMDVDKNGQSLHEFFEAVFEDGVSFGMSHVLVEYPQIPAGASLADERRLGGRPYFVHIRATDMLGARYRTDEAGNKILTSIRFVERQVEEDGRFGEKTVVYIRVYTESTWERYKWDEKTRTWLLDGEGTHTFGRVPLATFYTERTGFMTADPPLMDLAELNLQHWQLQSDYNNTLRFASIGILVAAGFTDEEIDEGITIAPNAVIYSSNKEANLKYVEQQGSAIGAARTNLQDIEAKMEVLGHAPLIERTQKSTATAKNSNDDKQHSNIQSWIRVLEKTIETCYSLAAQWTKEQVPEEFSADVFNDFGVTSKGRDDMSVLSSARAGRDLSRETYLQELKRRGVLSASVRVEEEMDRIASEPIDGGGVDIPDDENANSQ